MFLSDMRHFYGYNAKCHFKQSKIGLFYFLMNYLFFERSSEEEKIRSRYYFKVKNTM